MRTRIKTEQRRSPYFGGGFRSYGLYHWDIKYPYWNSEFEIESAVLWVFGDHIKIRTKSVNGNTVYGFDLINDLLGRSVEASIEGRSGGWFVVHEELSEEEIQKIDTYIMNSMKALPDFLKEERAFREEEEKL